MKTSKKSALSYTPLPLVFRLTAMLLLVAFPLTSVPVVAYAAVDSVPGDPAPLTDANAPAAVTTPKNVKVKTGSREIKLITPKLKFSAAPTDGEITAGRVFEEPLIPTTGKVKKKENAALAQALKGFQARQSVEDVSALTNFLEQHPDSRWKASLQLNIGLIQCQTGYFSKALASWSSAWNLAKGETDPMPKAMADRSIGEFLVLNARLGRVEVLQQYFPELEDRHFQGAATEKISAAREGLWRMQHRPEIAFKCGPFAVNSILNIGKTVKGRNPIIEAARSTEMGTSLAQVKGWADAVNLDYQMAKRSPGAAIIVPAVVHWTVGHFGAIVAQKGDRYLIQDPTFGGAEFWVSVKALESEGSGYFLVPSGPLPSGWRSVTDQEEAGTVWGRGGANYRSDNDTQGPKSGCPGTKGMAGVSIVSALATLHLEDTPIFYRPPVGPAMDFTVGYTHLEGNQPADFRFTNLGYGWTFNWLSYLTVDTSQNVSVMLRGGGTEVYNNSLTDTASKTNPDNVNNVYAPNVLSQAVLVLVSTGVYERRLPDGSKEVFSQPDGSGRIFLTHVVDPQGNSAVVHYDDRFQNDSRYFRIDYILDALNQKTLITYKSETPETAGFYKIHTITDPFSRVAQFDYDDATVTKLLKITDVVGLTSEFTYNNGTGTDTYITSGIDSLTTPYGKTLFYNYHPDGNGAMRGLKVIFPDGSQEVLENWIDHSLTTYFWDKKAMELYPGDQTRARKTHWLFNPNSNVQSSVMDRTQGPTEPGAEPESAVVYTYSNQPEKNHIDGDPKDEYHYYTGPSNKPSVIDRTLNGGIHQLYQYQYNSFGKVTQSIDPVGRKFSYSYAANGIDLMEVRQVKDGANDLVGKWYYNAQHRPVYYIDGSGQATSYGYNAQGQLTWMVPATGGTTTLTYDTKGYLTQIDGPLAGSNDIITYSYDGFGRRRTTTDSKGYTLTYDYDVLNRLTKVTYPDGTYEQTTWDRLDPILSRDRLGQWTQRNYNSVQQLVSETDPLGRTTHYDWCSCGSLGSIIDAAGHTTSWTRDLRGRPTRKTFADGTSTSYAYETDSGRLKSVTDAKNQVTNYTYNLDNSIANVSYTGINGQALSPSTSAVNFTYDANYPRLAAVQNDWGTLTYTYNAYITDPWGGSTTGAGRLQKISNNVLPNSDITYTYDAVGRELTRSIDGTNNPASAIYDAMGRVTSIANPLGTFGYTYVDPTYGTRRLDTVSYPNPNGQAINYSYYDNAGDQRLQEIKNLKPDTSVLSKYNYAYSADGQIKQWTQQADSATPLRYDLGYDKADQLTSAVLMNTSSNAVVKQYFYDYDAAGNRKSEQIDAGVRESGYNSVNALNMVICGGYVKFQGTLNEAGTVTVNGTPAKMTSGTSFEASTYLDIGTHTVPVTAKDGSNNTRTNNYTVVVNDGTDLWLSYDDEGSMTDNGRGQTYEWNAAKQLVAINYTETGARTEFTYNGLGQRVKIVEKDSGGNVTSTKQFLWFPGDAQPSEERDVNGLVTKRFYAQGEQIGTTSYYYTRDHLGSVREMTNSAGAIQARYSYDPYGRRTKVSGSLDADFGYTGHYQHLASGLALAQYRAYDAELGRWISRDPIGERGGLNLYGYIGNSPVNGVDPLGLAWMDGGGTPDGNALLKMIGNPTGDPALDEGGDSSGGGSGGTPCKNKNGYTVDENGIPILNQDNLLNFGLEVLAVVPLIIIPEGGVGNALVRTEARNLTEQLAMKEAMAGAGERIMQNSIKDPRYPAEIWAKMQHVHGETVIHYWKNIKTGITHGYKYK